MCVYVCDINYNHRTCTSRAIRRHKKVVVGDLTRTKVAEVVVRLERVGLNVNFHLFTHRN